VLAYLKLLVRDRKATVPAMALGIGALAFTGWALWAASFKMVGLSMIILVLGVPMRLWMKRADPSSGWAMNCADLQGKP